MASTASRRFLVNTVAAWCVALLLVAAAATTTALMLCGNRTEPIPTLEVTGPRGAP